MSDYNAYGELYDQRPELVIQERLRNSGLVLELAKAAQKNNFNVSFGRGPFHQDILIKWKNGSDVRSEGHSVTSCLRYFKKLESISD